jgi:predicted RNA methylase
MFWTSILKKLYRDENALVLIYDSFNVTIMIKLIQNQPKISFRKKNYFQSGVLKTFHSQLALKASYSHHVNMGEYIVFIQSKIL